MTAEIFHLPARELTTPPVEHTLTVRSGPGAGFYVNGKKVPLITAAAIVALMAHAIQLLSEAGHE